MQVYINQNIPEEDCHVTIRDVKTDDEYQDIHLSELKPSEPCGHYTWDNPYKLKPIKL